MAVDFSAHMFQRMNQDVSFDKRDPNDYWEAMNMELINNGNALSIVSTSGTKEVLTIDPIFETYVDTVGNESFLITYNNKSYNFNYVSSNPGNRTHIEANIIGLVTMRDVLYIFVQTEYNLNIIFRYPGTGAGTASLLDIVYAGYMNMKKENPIEIYANYENKEVQKLYWVDGPTNNWVRTINVSPLNADVLETMPVEFIDIAVPVSMDTPEVIAKGTGGNLKAGRIQYCYTLYNRSGQQTTVSPLSSPYSITDINGIGGESNELMNTALTVEITNLDLNYDSIRVYSIHYNEDGETPDVIVLLDEGIGAEEFTFTDDGNLFVSNTTLDHLIALSTSKYKAGTLNGKKNRLFLADYSIEAFDFDFDARAYSYDFSTTPVAKIRNVDGSEPITLGGGDYTVPPEHDSLNIDPATYYLTEASESTVYGGTGEFISYEFVTVVPNDNIRSFLKRGDKYRIGIVFRDVYGRASAVKWVADSLIPYKYGINSDGRGFTIKMKLTLDGANIARAGGAVGYSIVMVNRNYEDRDIIAQGFVVPTFQAFDGGGSPLNGDTNYYPYNITKDITINDGGKIGISYNNLIDFDARDSYISKADEYCVLYSPDIDFRESADLIANTVTICGKTAMKTAEVETTYEMWRNASWQFGNTTQSLNFNSNIWNADPHGDDLPNNYLGWTDGGGNATSYDVFFKKPYSNVVYKDKIDIEEVTLKLQSYLIQTGETKALDTVEQLNNQISIPGLSGGGKGLRQNFQDSVVLTFNDNSWRGDVHWSKFHTPVDASRYLPIVDIKRGIQNQYGGNSFEARRRNTYIEISNYKEFSTLGNTYLETNSGDVFVGTYIIARTLGENIIQDNVWHTYEYIRIEGFESYIDIDSRYDKTRDIWSSNEDILRPVKLEEWLGYNTAYSQLQDAITFIPKPYNFQEVTIFDTNIIASDIKFNNEVIDSWTTFLPNEILQLESKYGKITKLQEVKGDILAFQPKAIASISILPRVQVQASDGINLELGTGTVLQDYNYLTTVSGSLNKWSILNVHDEIIYYDFYNKSISSLNEGSLSLKYNIQKLITDIHNTNALYLERDNPLLATGVLTSYDSNKKNVYVSMLGTDSLTVSFNLMARGFISIHDFYPKIWVELNGDYVSTDKANILYEHIYEFNNDLNRTLYKSNVNSYITILSSKDPILNKIFGNVELDVTGNAIFNNIEAWNDYQTTGEIALVNRKNIRHSYRKWRIALPREENSRNILSDTKLWVKLLHKHDGANPIDNLVLNNVEIKYTK